MITQWINSVPGKTLINYAIIKILSYTLLNIFLGIFYAPYLGALSDNFGRKPLIIIPIIGQLLAFIVGIINWAFIEVLPIEFFYLDGISSLFGGLGMK